MRCLIILDVETDDEIDESLGMLARSSALAIEGHVAGKVAGPIRLCRAEARDAVIAAFDAVPLPEKRRKV